MTNNSSIENIEKKFNRMLKLRRMGIGFVLLLIFVALGIGAFYLFLARGSSNFPPPSYEMLDPQSSNYWKDRTLLNIKTVNSTKLSKFQKHEYLHSLVDKDIQTLQKISSPHQRIMALSDVAITLAEHDADIVIDDTLRKMDETELGFTMRARIFVSQALMYLRLNNKPAARVAISEYGRLLVSSDLKLENDINELSFIGAVSVLAVMDDTDGLNDLFRKQLSYTLRIGMERQMRAYRIIASEQARVQYIRQAVDSLKWITDHLELARACQSVISFASRPIPVEPTEPKITVPDTDIKAALPNRSVTLNTVNEVIRRAAAFEAVDDQIDLLLRIAGSRLMCDKEIYEVFKEAVQGSSSLDELVKRPILRLLNEPKSKMIRAALDMKPLEEERKTKIDTALDDWSSSFGGYAAQAVEIDPAQMQLISDLQTFRTLSMVSQSYLIASRRRDALRVLQNAVGIAKRLSHPIDRVNSLLVSADQQISAGDSSAAGKTLAEVGLPEGPSDASVDGRETTIYSETRLSELARLQIIARFFEDALKTIACIGTESIRNDDYVFLARELLRIKRTDLIKKIIETMPEAAARQEIESCLAIDRSENHIGEEKNFTGLRIPYPPSLKQDSDIFRCSNMLVRKGLLESARRVAERIVDEKTRSQALGRIAREYVLLFNAYRGEDENHRKIREDLLNWTLDTVEQIPDSFSQVSIWQEIANGTLPYAEKDETLRNRMKKLIDQVLDPQSPFMQNKSETPNDVQADLLIRLIDLKLGFAVPAAETSIWPMIDRETDRELYDEIKQKFDRAIELLNESNLSVQQGLALSRLAKLAGQVGRLQSSRSLIHTAEECSNDLSDMSDRVSVLLELIPTMQALEEIEMVRSTFHRAFMLASDSFVNAKTGSDTTIQWRYRDMELDRIVREQIRMNYLSDAAGFATMINEPMIRDRLLRSIAYIYVDQNKTAEAEIVARKINTEAFRMPAIRNILFMKKMQAKSKSETETKAVSEPKTN